MDCKTYVKTFSILIEWINFIDLQIAKIQNLISYKILLLLTLKIQFNINKIDIILFMR